MAVSKNILIPTAVHGCIDYGVAALLEAAAQSSALSPRVRRVLGVAGAYHAGYSLVTDYELGVRPWLSMQQHLALDTLGAAAVFGVGACMRSAPARDRRLLMAAGLAELAVVALSDNRPTRGPALPAPVDVAYSPVDTLKRVADDVFVVDSVMHAALGMRLPVRMTVFKLPDGSLLLHSPTQMTWALREELERIGPVKHLVAPNSVHWMMVKQWQDAYPDAEIWAAPGLSRRWQVRRSGLRIDHELQPAMTHPWGDAIEVTTIQGGLGFREMAVLHKPSRTLVLTDLVLNLEAYKLPTWFRPIARLFGSLDGMPPPYLRVIFRMRRPQASRAVSRLIAAQPDRVIFAHGRWYDVNATSQLRASTGWL